MQLRRLTRRRCHATLFVAMGGARVSEVERLAEAARQRWPGVVVDGERFGAYVTARAGDPPEALSSLRTDDLYLACACAHGDARALDHFERECQAAVQPGLHALKLADDVIDEAWQRVRTSLLTSAPDREPGIASYSGRSRLSRWVRTIVIREAVRVARRHRAPRAPMSALDKLASPAANPEVAYLKRLYRQHYKAVFASALATLTPRQRNLLRYHLVEGMTMNEIAVLYETHRTTVGRWIGAAQAALIDRAKDDFVARTGVATSVVPSLMGLIASQLTLSLPRLLPAGEVDVDPSAAGS